MTDVGRDPGQGFDVSIAAGAQLETLYVRRSVKAYALHEADVRLLGQLNGQASTYFSAASFVLALALGILANAAFVKMGEMPPAGLVLRNFGTPLLLGIAILFGGMGYQAHRKRDEVWSEIKAGSVSV